MQSMDVCIDVFTGMCIDMYTDMCTGMCIDMRTGMYIDMCTGMCIDIIAQHVLQYVWRDIDGRLYRAALLLAAAPIA